MPYTTKKTDGKITVSKKVGGHTKVVGHTTPAKKDKYLAALHIHSSDKDKKQEGIEGHLGQVFVVRKPYQGVELSSMVHPIDPLVGLEGSEIVPDQVHMVCGDQDHANSIAQQLHQQQIEQDTIFEEKKGTTVEKIKKAIDKLELKRKEHIALAKENPGEASSHKDHIANLATKIDDLMTKMEKIEKSKKSTDKKEDKKEK